MAYVPAELRLRFWTFSAWWRFMFAIRLSCLSDIRDSQRRLMHTPAVPLESKGSNWWSVPLIEDSVYTDREYKIMERLNTVAWNSNARMTRPTNDGARALADATHAPSVWTVLLVDFHRSSCSLEIKKLVGASCWSTRPGIPSTDEQKVEKMPREYQKPTSLWKMDRWRSARLYAEVFPRVDQN